MAKQIIDTATNPTVHITSIHGNLQLKGWGRAQILIKTGDEGPSEWDSQEERIEIACNSDCHLWVPHEAQVTIDQVHGNARIKLLDAALKIGKIHGSLILQDINETAVEQVDGNLLAKQVIGTLYIQKVSGNTIARDIQGICNLEQVDGNLELRDCDHDIFAKANGNTRISLGLLAGSSSQIEAGGNLSCRVPENIDAQVSLKSEAGDIKTRVHGEKKRLNETSYQLQLGNGEATLSLSCQGTLSFECRESDWNETDDIQAEFAAAFSGYSDIFNEQIETQLDAHIEAIRKQIDNITTSLENSGLSTEAREKILQRTYRAAEQASARAQERIQRAQEKMERKLSAARQRAELKARAAARRSKRRSASARSPKRASDRGKAQGQPATDDERLLILRMLEEKKITPIEAENLLAALEGSE